MEQKLNTTITPHDAEFNSWFKFVTLKQLCCAPTHLSLSILMILKRFLLIILSTYEVIRIVFLKNQHIFKEAATIKSFARRTI